MIDGSVLLNGCRVNGVYLYGSPVKVLYTCCAAFNALHICITPKLNSYYMEFKRTRLTVVHNDDNNNNTRIMFMVLSS